MMNKVESDEAALNLAQNSMTISVTYAPDCPGAGNISVMISCGASVLRKVFSSKSILIGISRQKYCGRSPSMAAKKCEPIWSALSAVFRLLKVDSE